MSERPPLIRVVMSRDGIFVSINGEPAKPITIGQAEAILGVLRGGQHGRKVSDRKG